MEYWKTLGIEATKDKRVIKLAYTELLKKYPPAEFPEEFKNIRKAYDFANKEAQQSRQANREPLVEDANMASFESGGTELISDNEFASPGVVDKAFFDEEEPLTPVSEGERLTSAHVELGAVRSLEQLNSALTQLYKHVLFRSDLDQWKKLFSAPIFWDVDQGEQRSRLLVEFLSEHYLLPKPVLWFLDKNIKLSTDLVFSKDLKCRELAIGLKHFIDSLPQRIDFTLELEDKVRFSLLHEHLRLRHSVEEHCIYRAVTAQQLMAIMDKVDPLFYNDDQLYLYVVKNLWSLGAYEEITNLLKPCSISESISFLGNYLAHAEFILGHYDEALVLYTAQREREKDYFEQCYFREIGLCYLHLKCYKKAYSYLYSYSYFRVEDLDAKAALITARRCYIKELKKAEADHAIEIATLQFENGRYRDALVTTQTYSQVFDEAGNYLEALCWARLEHEDQAFEVYQKFITRYQLRNYALWPLLVDLLAYCSDRVNYSLLMDVIVHNMPKTVASFYQHEYFPGSIHKRVYSEYEIETLDLSPNTYDGEPNKPMSNVSFHDIEYKQYYAWASVHELFAKKVKFEDPNLVVNLKKIAVESIKHIMTKMAHEPRSALKFVSLFYDEGEFDICLRLIEIALKSYPNSYNLFYYKGLSLFALEKRNEAIEILAFAGHLHGYTERGVMCLKLAIECCDKLAAIGQEKHEQYDELCLKLKEAQEFMDAV